MTEQDIQQFISKLPFLETLNLQISFCLRRLKRLSLFGSSCNLLEELVIDCPNLCLYNYRGFVSPLFSINTSCLHYVTITLMLHAIHTHTHSHTQWFLGLRKYLANFKQINCLQLLYLSPPNQVSPYIQQSFFNCLYYFSFLMFIYIVYHNKN